MTAIAECHRSAAKSGRPPLARRLRPRKKMPDIGPHPCRPNCAKLSLAGEVARKARGWGLYPRAISLAQSSISRSVPAETPPPRPSPASGRGGRSPPPLGIHRDRHQRALRDHGGQRRLLARLQRGGRELFDDSDQPRRAEVPQRRRHHPRHRGVAAHAAGGLQVARRDDGGARGPAAAGLGGARSLSYLDASSCCSQGCSASAMAR